MAHKALCVGLNYPNNPWPSLFGCVNDALRWAHLLDKKLSFETRVLIDQTTNGEVSTNQAQIPTHANLTSQLRWLCNSSPGDVVVLVFSGYGTQRLWGDMCENALVCSDLNLTLLGDAELSQIFRLLPAGVMLTVIADCTFGTHIIDLPCRFGEGGNVMDQPFVAPPLHLKSSVWEKSRHAHAYPRALTPVTEEFSPTLRLNPGVTAFCIAASHADEVALDANLKNHQSGVMTFSLLQALTKFDYHCTYEQLVDAANATMKDIKDKYMPAMNQTISMSHGIDVSPSEAYFADGRFAFLSVERRKAKSEEGNAHEINDRMAKDERGPVGNGVNSSVRDIPRGPPDHGFHTSTSTEHCAQDSMRSRGPRDISRGPPDHGFHASTREESRDRVQDMPSSTASRGPRDASRGPPDHGFHTSTGTEHAMQDSMRSRGPRDVSRGPPDHGFHTSTGTEHAMQDSMRSRGPRDISRGPPDHGFHASARAESRDRAQDMPSSTASRGPRDASRGPPDNGFRTSTGTEHTMQDSMRSRGPRDVSRGPPDHKYHTAATEHTQSTSSRGLRDVSRGQDNGYHAPATSTPRDVLYGNGYHAPTSTPRDVVHGNGYHAPTSTSPRDPPRDPIDCRKHGSADSVGTLPCGNFTKTKLRATTRSESSDRTTLHYPGERQRMSTDESPRRFDNHGDLASPSSTPRCKDLNTTDTVKSPLFGTPNLLDVMTAPKMPTLRPLRPPFLAALNTQCPLVVPKLGIADDGQQAISFARMSTVALEEPERSNIAGPATGG